MKSRVTLMTEGRPVGLIVRFALPLMFGNIFQQLYSVVDSMIVGKTLGVAALAALGASSWPNWIMVGMIMGLTQGISILLARSFGKGDEDELRRGFVMTTYVAQNLGACRFDRIHSGVRSAAGAAVATAVAIAAIMLLLGRTIIHGFVSGTPEEIASTVDVAYRYLAIMCVCHKVAPFYTVRKTEREYYRESGGNLCQAG